MRRSKHHRTEKFYIKLVFGLAAALVLVVGGIVFGKSLFERWQERRLINRAEEALTRGDKRSASLSARRLLQIVPENAEAARVLATIAESSDDASAVEWRRKAAISSSHSIEDQLALARAALRFKQLAIAETALNDVSTRAQNVPAYHALKGDLAVARKRPDEAKKEYGVAVGSDPQNREYQLTMALFQLESGNEGEKSNARLQLREFMNDATLRLRAARGLRDDALRQRDGRSAFEFQKQIADFSEATFPDRLGYVQMLHDLDSPAFTARLSEAQTEATADPGKLVQLLSWMSANRLALVALEWVKRLPKETLFQTTVPVAVADCFAAAQDWTGLDAWCSKSPWGEVEFLRHAFRCRALRKLARDLDADAEWNLATKAAGSDGAKLSSLQRNISKWGWEEQSLALLWALVDKKDQSALGALQQYYLSKRDTASLYRVALHQAELKPDDRTNENNLAQLALLLGVDIQRAAQTARRLHEQEPENPVFASTYGFSLHVLHKSAEAVRVFQALTPENQREPSIAAYYGIVLAAAGQRDSAREFLRLGATADLLPEERALYERALASVSES